MPKAARFTLKWSGTQSLYALYEHGHLSFYINGPAWHDWLATHTSFAFHGKHNHATLLKEVRKNKGDGYWYAYRRQGKQTSKRYVGRSIELTPARLEEITGAQQDGQTLPPLLAQKFRPPQIPDTLVQRTRLLSHLDSGLEQRLTLLAAPAGSGKTTLVSQWLLDHTADQHFPSVAWLSLENSDNDPLRFWRYLLTACETLHTGSTQSALAQLLMMPQFHLDDGFLETILTTFLNDLARSSRRGILVLEDYHVITSPSIHKTLTFLLDHLPASLHVVIITRSNPPLPLGRLRVQGTLCEIDAHELRFSQTESAAFLQQLQLASFATTTHILQQLDARLEGWAAGLRLFALFCQGVKQPSEIEQLLANFVNDHRPLQDYFATEVLNAQPAHLQTFLLHTCILNRLSASLCNALTGRQNGQAQLERIERMGLFIERLNGPGHWYRYHALFAQALTTEARRRLGATKLRALSLQASRWYAQQGLQTEAIEAALQAEEMCQAAELIQRYLTARGSGNIQEFYTLYRWLEPLPMDVLRSRPLLCLSYALALALRFAPEHPTTTAIAQIEELLTLAETSWRQEENMIGLGQVFSIRMQKALWESKLAQAIDYARQALHWLPEEMVQWRGMCLNIMGAGELSAGQLIQARKTLQEALTLWTATGHLHGMRSCMLILGGVYFEEGALRLAAEDYQHVLQEARELGDREDIIPALIGQARLLYEWNDLDEAAQVAQEACNLSEEVHSLDLLLYATLILVRIWHQQGHTIQSRQRLSALMIQLQTRPELMHEALLCQIRLLLMDEDYAAARHHLTHSALQDEKISPIAQEQRALLQATLLLRQSDARTALQNLERLRTDAQKAGRGRIQLEIQLLIAQALHAEHDLHTAHQTLQAVLIFAHTEGYRRLILDQGQELAPLLRALQSQIQEQPLATYLHTLLQAIEPASPEPVPVNATLSPQEQRVLQLLLAERTYPEIAQELVVSINTIKTQARSVYRKLNVHNRREARARAATLSRQQ